EEFVLAADRAALSKSLRLFAPADERLSVFGKQVGGRSVLHSRSTLAVILCRHSATQCSFSSGGASGSWRRLGRWRLTHTVSQTAGPARKARASSPGSRTPSGDAEVLAQCLADHR